MKYILLPALAGLALFSAGCACPKSDVRYVAKDSVPVYKVSPQLLGEWQGQLDVSENSESTTTYECTLEITSMQTWILRGFGPNKVIPGDFFIINEGRISGNFDVIREGWYVTLGSKDEIIITRSHSGGPSLITFKRKK